MDSDQHLPLIASLPSLVLSTGLPLWLFHDPPLPSAYSKESGQSRWLVFTMYPSLVSYSLGLYCCLFVSPILFPPLCLDYIAI